MKKKFLNFLDEGEDFLILLHENADPDAVGAAIALKEYLVTKGKKVGVHADSYSKISKNLIKNFDESFIPISSKNMIVLDTSSVTQLGKCAKYLETAECIFVIDHHQDTRFENFPNLTIINEERTSTAEIIYSILPEKNEKILKSLLAGIITDTGGFRYSDEKTFETVFKIVNQGIKISEIFNLLRQRMNVSKKMAILKSLQRLEIHRKSGKIIATTMISSYESSVSSFLLNFADVVFVGNLKQKRINAKTTLDIDVSQIMKRIESVIEGEGGGHKKAAGAKGKNIEEGITECVRITKNLL